MEKIVCDEELSFPSCDSILIGPTCLTHAIPAYTRADGRLSTPRTNVLVYVYNIYVYR